MVSTVNRTWNDVNRNFVPDCDLRSPDANAECGAISNRNFGTVVPGIQRDPEVLEGWHNREFSWQSSVSVDHQLQREREAERRILPDLVRQLPGDGQPGRDAGRLRSVLHHRAGRRPAAGRRQRCSRFAVTTI